MACLKGVMTGFAAAVAVLLVFLGGAWLYSGIRSGFFSGIQYDGRAVYAHFYPLPEAILTAVFLLGFVWQLKRSTRERTVCP